ncbi:hypothetical protein Prudu_021146 [Prunus dulcis]|uniref:TMV resistance protein N-like n=1 Tax=Prunus dulcis TaxID=3755 RepID=A0A4Y1RWU3_PRUDU|nr:hypothetical protein Prudu_021146 [Prunus dulcis]
MAILSSKLRLGRKIPFRKGNDATSLTHYLAMTYDGFWHSEVVWPSKTAVKFYVITSLAVEGLRVVENCVFRQSSSLLSLCFSSSFNLFKALTIYTMNCSTGKQLKLSKDDRDLEIGASISPELLTQSNNHILPSLGSSAEAFTKHEEKFSEDVNKVKRWRDALKEVANLSGLDSKNYQSKAELIKHIVKCVFRKVHPMFMLSGSLDKLVGIDSALEQLHLQLAPKDNDVRFIGIWRMGGILFSILKENVAHVWDEGAGTFITQKRLCNKKVLLILDGVDQLNQLKTLAGKKDWFGAGSRIIITTRDERLLVEHGIAIRYKVEVLKDNGALELFSQNAFTKNQPEEGFLELSRCFVHYAKGLPLALTTLGSFLYARGQDTWKSALDNLGKIHNPTIFHSLKVSYDGLEEIDKKILLDVACFHKGKDEEQMHDLIQEMARKIVHLQSPRDPCQRSRLWLRDDISLVFMHNSEMRALEGIVLRLPISELVDWNCTEAFNEMHGLRLLDFDNVVFSSSPKFLPNSLRIIQWSWYPSKSLPSSFEPHLLSKLEMRDSKLVQLWDGAKWVSGLYTG